LKSLGAIPLLAVSLLLLKPKLSHSMSSLASPRQPYLVVYASAIALAVVTGSLLFSELPGITDFLVAALLGYG
jgi:hypothetical protein